MKIALVCPNYQPNRSYQENIWAEQLARMGHKIRLVSSARHDESITRVKEHDASYEVQRVATWKLPRHTFWSGKVARAVREFHPGLIVSLGDKLFSRSVLNDPSLAAIPVVSTYSENIGMHDYDWQKPGLPLKERLFAVAYLVMRGGPIRKACRRSVLIVCNTPQTRAIVLRVFPSRQRPAVNSRMVDMPLGFSPQDFTFSKGIREKTRSELDVADHEVLVCVSSHFAQSKEPYVRLMIEALRIAMDKDPSLRAVIVGFTDDPRYAEISRRIARFIDEGPHPDRIIKHPFAGRSRLCAVYNASDVAAFGRASISCQEALGTGLVGCFADDGSVNHLVTRSDQGVFFRPNDGDDLTSKLMDAAQIVARHRGPDRDRFRQSLADSARWLGCDRIIAATYELAQQRIQGSIASIDDVR